MNTRMVFAWAVGSKSLAFRHLNSQECSENDYLSVFISADFRHLAIVNLLMI